MKNKKVGIIKVLTTNDEKLLKAHQNILNERFPDLDTETKCIKDQPKGIYDDDTLRIAVPKIVDLAHEFEDRGFDMVYISCAGDPGLDECRNELGIPVIGAGAACSSLALSYGSRIGVMGITKEIPKAMYKILKDHIVCYIKPEGINTTLDLYADRGLQKVLTVANQFKEKGCDVIALGCTGMATINVHKKIIDEMNIVTIDPVIASGIIISYLL